MRLTAAVTILGVVAAAGTGCSGGGDGPANPVNPPAEITVTATLADPTPALLTSAGPTLVTVPTAWAGFTLRCVSLASPPAMASGVANASGGLSFTFAAKGVPFGCYLVDAGGTAVATLIFASGPNHGLSIVLNGSVDLGAIVVTPGSGVAVAQVPTGGSLGTTTPAGLACPLGMWAFDAGASGTCGGSHITADFWIARDPSGSFVSSFTAFNTMTRIDACGPESWARVTTSYTGNSVVIGPFDASRAGCPAKTMTLVMTVDASCRTMSGNGIEAGCPTGQTLCTCGTIPMTAAWH